MWTHKKNNHWFFRSIWGAMLVLGGLLWINPLQAADESLTSLTPDKLVPINTIDSQSGSTGISIQINRFCGDAVGDGTNPPPTCFYANPGSSDDVHVLVLDQLTLQPFSATQNNQNYPANQHFSTDASGLTSLNSFLTGLAGNKAAVDSVLVMLVYNSSNPVAFASIVQGLQAIGQQVVPPEGRPWSIIGIPGMVPGKAAWNLAEPLNNSAPGGLKGYIRESWLYQNANNFQHRQFDFGYVEGYTVTPVAEASEAQNAKIELAGEIYSPPAVPAGSSAGGFYAVQFNTVTLESSEQAFWISNDSGCVDFAELSSFLLQFKQPSLSGVAMASLGKAWTEKSGCNAGDWKQLLETMELLDLNPDIFARAVNTNLASPYSMISSNGRYGQGLAHQASAVLTDWVAIQTGNSTDAEKLPQADGVLAGALRRNAVLGQIYPATGDPAGLYTTELEGILVQDPVDWPMTPQPGATATTQETAFGWVVICTQGGTLSSEWNSGTPSSNEVVRQTLNIFRQDYVATDFPGFEPFNPLPSKCDVPSFTQAELNNAVTQLTAEEDDYKKVTSFFNTLLKPLVSQATGSLYDNITNVAKSIANDELNADTTLTVSNSSNWGASIFQHTLQGLQIALGFFDAGPAGEIVGDFLSATSSGFKFILGATTPSPTGLINQTDEYLILQSQLSQDSSGVVTQVENSISQWQASMGAAQAAVLQDWGRMEAVSANLVPGGKWLFTQDDVNTMANAWDTLARQQTYYAYWPLLYNVGAARVSGDGSAPGYTFPNTWECTGLVTTNDLDGDTDELAIQPFVDNGGITSYGNNSNKNSSTATPSNGAFCGQGFCGIGDGQTYLPLFDIFGDDPEQLVVYMFDKSWDLSLISGSIYGGTSKGTFGQGYAKIVPADTMTNLTDQIVQGSAASAANFYPPTFWFKARSPNQLACGSGNAKLISSGFYTDPGTPSVMQTVSTSDSTALNSTAATNRALNAGDFISVGITVQSMIQNSDLYMGALLPDGDTVFFVTALDPLTLQHGSLDNPESYRPLAEREKFPNGVTAHFPNLVSYLFTGAEPDGTYQFFSAIVRKDAFSDGRFNERDLLSVDIDPFTVGSQEGE